METAPIGSPDPNEGLDMTLYRVLFRAYLALEDNEPEEAKGIILDELILLEAYGRANAAS